jgi:hypothetical protein
VDRRQLGIRVVGAAALFLLTVEGLVAYVNPKPRFQVVTGSDSVVLYERDGVPLWHETDPEPRWQTRCPDENPDAARILVFGSSILHGVDLSAHQVFSRRLQDGSRGALCVLNFAESGFTMAAKIARVAEVIERHPDAQVLMEIWENDPNPYTLLGRSAYGLRDQAVDRQGYPASLWVPAPLNGWLFRHSHAYEYAALGLAKPVRPADPWTERILPDLDRLKTLVGDRALTLLFMPKMADPLGEQIGGHEYRKVIDWADAHGVPWIEAGALLKDQTTAGIALDRCCHLNARGHEILAERLGPILSR